MKKKKSLKKLANRKFKGYPVATIAYYGPDDQHASKVAVSIILREDEEVSAIKRWFTEDSDIRRDITIGNEILAFIKESRAKSVVMADRILGCPHEEGKDYPEGEKCPQCPFWANRDRFTGEVIH